MANKKFKEWRDKVFATKNISPLRMGMTQEDIIVIFGKPDTVSTMEKNGRPLIFKYKDIEFHFDERIGHTLFLVYSEEDEGLSIMEKVFPNA